MRRLNANEIECRVGQKSKDGSKYSVLLYKTARTDMAILDEMYGQSGWKCDYQMVGSSMFCTISVWDNDKGEWVSKQSNGSESNIEADKGQASDAFKRAGFLWGVGRELYSAPSIWLDAKINPYSLSVAEIGYSDKGDITYLIIMSNNDPVFTFGKCKVNKSTGKVKTNVEVGEDIEKKLEFTKKLTGAGVDLEKVAKYYKKEKPEDMTLQELEEACNMKHIA